MIWQQRWTILVAWPQPATLRRSFPTTGLPTCAGLAFTGGNGSVHQTAIQSDQSSIEDDGNRNADPSHRILARRLHIPPVPEHCHRSHSTTQGTRMDETLHQPEVARLRGRIAFGAIVQCSFLTFHFRRPLKTHGHHHHHDCSREQG